MAILPNRLKFDTAQYPFATIVEQEIRSCLAATDQEAPARLELMHEVDSAAERLEQHRQLLFTMFRKELFQRYYRALGKDLIELYFTDRALIQKTPTVRIHLADGMSVSFHCDAWYGHGRNVHSFWLPLTRVYGTNSLQMARSAEESREFLRLVETQQLDLDEINSHAATICEPIVAEFGDLIVFDGDMVHGTTTNTTHVSRVSFDFRIAESVDDIGNKPIANFYKYSQLDSAQHAGETQSARLLDSQAALMYSGTCRGVTAKSQLIFLNEYARVNNINIVGSESEIVVFEYAPVLQKYARSPTSSMNSILLFSVDLLPPQLQLRQKIYRNAIANGIALLFAAEDFALRQESEISRAERYFQHSRQAA